MTKRSSSLIRNIVSLAIFLVFFGFIQGYLPSRYLKVLEEQFYDFRLRSDLLNTVDERIVILDIDEKSIAQIGHWPWRRKLLAELMEKLFTDYEISVLGFDIVFPELESNESRDLLNDLTGSTVFQNDSIQSVLKAKIQQVDGDIQFAESIAARNVVLGYTFEPLHADSSDYYSKGLLSDPLIKKEFLQSTDLNLYTAGGFIANYEYLTQATLYGGFFNYPRIGSSLRKVPLLYRFEGDLYPSLGLQTAMVSLGLDSLEMLFAQGGENNSLNLESIKIGEQKIAVDGSLSVYVPYRGPIYSFPYVSIIDVLNGTVAIERLKNKIVLLGTTATGMMDLRATPISDTFVGVEVHANIISGILDQRFKSAPSYLNAVEIFLLLLCTLLLHILLPRLGALGSVTTFVLTLAMVFSVAMIFWHYYDFVLPMANAVLLILTASFFHIAFGYFVESKNKRRMNRFFGQYIPAELVKELDQSDAEVSLKGMSKNMSVLFSDVRGFTTISEGLEAKELTQLMNEFLTPITQVIQDNRGTIDKYMGDAVMAFWGAPLDDKLHANHAVKTAFAMIDAMYQIRPHFKQKNWPEINIGVGISSGDMRVGNMGSEFRMAYTVLGDVVNLGSRLEGLTKNYGVNIIVSEETAKQADYYVYRELDRVRVKGKNEPVIILEPIARQDEITREQALELEEHRKGLSLYHRRCWNEALSIFSQLKERCPRMIYDIYLQRAADYLENPPPQDWDGVFTHTSK